MTRKQIIITVSGVVAVLVIVGGGLWWRSHENHKRLEARQAAASAQDQSSSSGSSSLSIGGNASNLGQLGGNQSQNSGNGSSSSGSSGDVDPSTFAQYDKYKPNTSALFGDIQAGSGSQLGVGQKASIYYKVWLTNGALVDQSPVSSGGQPQPYGFTLGAHQVIPGLEQGVSGMKTGGKRLVIVPPAVGYGSQGQGSVPPNAVLVFEVQLVNVQ